MEEFERVVDEAGVLGAVDGELRSRCAACSKILPDPRADCPDHPLEGRDLVVILAGRLTPDEAAQTEAVLLATVWDIPLEPPAGGDAT